MNFLFIHGWATDRWVWHGVAGDISEGGNITEVNLPGHGGPLQWDVPTLGPAVEAVEETISTLPDGSVTGIGWSLGAEVLLSAAVRFREKFAGLVLTGATPSFAVREGFPLGQSRALVRRMIMDMKRDPAAALERFYRLNFTDAEITSPGAREFMKYYRYPGPVLCGDGKTSPPGCVPAFRYSEITTALEALYKTDLREELKKIKVPVLLVHGAEDNVTPAGAGQYLAETIEGAELKIFEGAGHAPFITQRGRFVEMARGFCARLKGSPR